MAACLLFLHPSRWGCTHLPAAALAHVFRPGLVLALVGPHRHLCHHSQEHSTRQPWGKGKEQWGGRSRSATHGLSNLPDTEPACSLLPWRYKHLGWRNEPFNYCLTSKWRVLLENWQVLSNARGAAGETEEDFVFCAALWEKGVTFLKGWETEVQRFASQSVQPVKHPLV